MKDKKQIEEETAFARRVSIVDVADHFGYKVKRAGNTYRCDGTDGSLVLFPETNSFFDYYSNQGGSPIDFVIRETGQDIKNAIEYLINGFGGHNANSREKKYERLLPVDKVKPNTSKKEHEQLVMPPRNDNHRRVFAYLSKSRHISANIIQQLLHDKKLYESADKHNAVFVEYDSNGIARHCFIRGTITGVQFRGDAYGSDKDYGFSVKGTTDGLIVFEAPIDLLSYMTIYPDDNNHKLALGMLSELPIYRYLEENKNVSNVSMLLDNDIKGNEAAEIFIKKLNDKGYKADYHDFFNTLKTSGKKDVNEYLSSVAVFRNNNKSRAKGR